MYFLDIDDPNFKNIDKIGTSFLATFSRKKKEQFILTNFYFHLSEDADDDPDETGKLKR